jgi:hypothetical protein
MDSLPQPLLITQNDQMIFVNKASNKILSQTFKSPQELKEKFKKKFDFTKSNDLPIFKILAKRGSPEKDYSFQEILMLTSEEVSDLTLKIIWPNGLLAPDNKCYFKLMVSDNVLINN